jgi:SAM-dependent methyltransferase
MSSAMASFLASNPTDQHRFEVLRNTLHDLSVFVRGRDVLDYGASDGLSMSALIDAGARSVVGVEPDLRRVQRAHELFPELRLLHVSDTRQLPFPSANFSTVVVNAVLEHIPQPREAYIREIWRVLSPGGYLIVNETPNKYLPWDSHTTHLPLLNWLPKNWARGIAIRTGRFRPDSDWDHSGWRGVGQRELFTVLSGRKDVSPKTRFRHHLFGQLLDPYPTWVLQKLP